MPALRKGRGFKMVLIKKFIKAVQELQQIDITDSIKTFGEKFINDYWDWKYKYFVMGHASREDEVQKYRDLFYNMVKTIEFYGSEDNWSKPYRRQGQVGRQIKGQLHKDGGEMARQCLELLKR